jgi:hypothetical protein
MQEMAEMKVRQLTPQWATISRCVRGSQYWGAEFQGSISRLCKLGIR